MKTTFLAAAALAFAATSAVHAADAPKPATPAAKPATAAAKPAAAKPGAATPAKPTPAQVANMQRAARILRAFNALFESKETTQPVKTALLACLYNNKLATISAAAGQVIAKNPALKEDNITDVLHAAGGVCGLKFGTSAAAAPAPAPLKPVTPSTGTTGR
jgi:hypothetical protein